MSEQKKRRTFAIEHRSTWLCFKLFESFGVKEFDRHRSAGGWHVTIDAEQQNSFERTCADEGIACVVLT